MAAALLRIAGALAAPTRARGKLSILIYHRVLPARDPIFPADVDATWFDRQMRALKASFNVLALSEAVERVKRGTLPPMAASVTFDDGYADNHDIALPILKRHGIQAMFFIATRYLEGGRMWNDSVIEAVRGASAESLDLTSLGFGVHVISTPAHKRRAIDQLIAQLKYRSQAEREEKALAIAELSGAKLAQNLMMRAEQVRALRAGGMEIGGHTASHPILTRLNAQAARAEIDAGRSRLQEILREKISLFAYPNGKPGEDYAREHVNIVKELGFDAAVSTAWGAAGGAADIFQLPRFTPWDESTLKFLLRLVRTRLQRDYTTV